MHHPFGAPATLQARASFSRPSPPCARGALASDSRDSVSCRLPLFAFLFSLAATDSPSSVPPSAQSQLPDAPRMLHPPPAHPPPRERRLRSSRLRDRRRRRIRRGRPRPRPPPPQDAVNADVICQQPTGAALPSTVAALVPLMPTSTSGCGASSPEAYSPARDYRGGGYTFVAAGPPENTKPLFNNPKSVSQRARAVWGGACVSAEVGSHRPGRIAYSGVPRVGKSCEKVLRGRKPGGKGMRKWEDDWHDKFWLFARTRQSVVTVDLSRFRSRWASSTSRPP